MSEVPNRVDGEIIEAEHINTNKDRTVQRYTSAANRDALNPNPVSGEAAWLTDITQLQIWDGTAWLPVGTGDFVGLTGGTMTGVLSNDAGYRLGEDTAPSMIWDESPNGVYRMYVTDGSGTGVRYGLQLFASGDDFLDLWVDGHLYSTGIVNDSEPVHRNVSVGSDPVDPIKGDLWIDAVGKAVKVWTGSSWTTLIQGV